MAERTLQIVRLGHTQPLLYACVAFAVIVIAFELIYRHY